MTLPLKTFAIVAPILFAVAGSARAQDVFTFSGFGTLASSKSSTDDAEFVSSSIQPAGATRSEDVKVDTKVGLQAGLRFGKMFSATAQVLAKRDVSGSFAAEAERGFLKFNYEETLSFSAGRIALPLFLIVENRDIGYANPGVRQPVEVYGSLPISNIDGANLTYSERLGGATLALQAVGGKFKREFPPTRRNTVVEADAMVGVDLSAEYGSFSARAGVFRANLTIDSTATVPLVNQLRQILPAISAAARPLADKIEIRDDPSTLVGVGAAFDNGTFLIRSEYAKLITEGDATGNWDSSYVTLAVKVSKWQPSATYSVIRPDVTLLNPFTPVTFPAETAAVNAFLASAKVSQKTVSYALRYEAYKNVAAKLQVDEIKADKGANLFVNQKAAFDGSATVYTLALDFKF